VVQSKTGKQQSIIFQIANGTHAIGFAAGTPGYFNGAECNASQPAGIAGRFSPGCCHVPADGYRVVAFCCTKKTIRTRCFLFIKVVILVNVRFYEAGAEKYLLFISCSAFYSSLP
jgi:hypothetical protein